MIPLARELGIGIVPWAPMGAGFLTGAITSRADFKEGDLRANHHTKMSEENFDKVCSSRQMLSCGVLPCSRRMCICILLQLIPTSGTHQFLRRLVQAPLLMIVNRVWGTA